MSLTRDQLTELARHGAAARIHELEQEIAAIRSAFRGLGVARRGGARKHRRRAGRRMSAANRKAASLRMKKYWAARRKGRT